MFVDRLIVATLLAAAILSPRAGIAQSRSSTVAAASVSYMEIFDLYRHGRAAEALAALSTVSDRDVERNQRQIIQSLVPSPSADPRAVAVRVGALMHAQAAFWLIDRNPTGAQRNLAVARTYIEKLASREPDSFVHDWWIMVIGFFQGRFDLQQANLLTRAARASAGNSPELLLAEGVTQEMNWTRAHDDDRPYVVTGDLKDAESSYRKALAEDRDLVEARLRLGRVLTLKGELDDALRVLDPLGSTGDAGFRYLAQLFAGDALERRGNAAAAETRYVAAFSAIPTGQSARLALAHLRHAAGARTAAADAVRATALERGVAETADPWFLYIHGLYWRTGAYLRTLLKQVEP
jgi:tetratricopeptide (TPR) repeat protein